MDMGYEFYQPVILKQDDLLKKGKYNEKYMKWSEMFPIFT